jgi:hypothetical protein
MTLLEIYGKLNCSYGKLVSYAYAEGHNISYTTMREYIIGEEKDYAPTTVAAVRAALIHATKKWRPKLTKEVETYFNKKSKEKE